MLKINDLRVAVEDNTILKGVDLTVKAGEVHAIMGPNGSGKSTLAYALAGHPHYTVTGGTVRLGKKDLLDMAPDERAQAGLFLAFQYPVTIEGISVQNFLRSAYQALYPDEKMKVLAFRKQLAKLAEELELPVEMLARSLNDGFSGGEKKRIEVLQMLALKPRIAICDETDSGLDIDSIKLAAEGIAESVKQHNTGVIIITHYQRILNYIKPSHVHVMKDGKIAKSGGMELVKDLETSGYKGV